jgi:dCMP deaminase
MTRPDWTQYFLGIAAAVSTRGECRRSLVGAVIVRDYRIVSTGYNGVAAGQPSCLDGACPRGLSDLPSGARYDTGITCIAIHAEQNAVMDAQRRDLDVRGATIYVSKEPCEGCLDLVDRCGLTAIWDSTRHHIRLPAVP